MKKIVSILAVVILIPFFIPLSGGNGNLKIVKNGKYCVIEMEGMEYAINPGYPMLPCKTEVYTFPMGTEIKKVEVRAENVERIKMDKKIEPSPMAIPLNGKELKTKEGEIYSTDVFYPFSWYSYTMRGGIENGKHVLILSLHLYPVRYNAVKNQAIYAKNFQVKIDYEIKYSLLPTDSYDLLIIAPDEWINELQSLKEYKDKNGISTVLVGLNEIYGGKYFTVQGRDEAEKIKYFIKDAIETWGIKYVMLVGDAEKMPVRYVDTGINDIPTTPADLYYSDIYNANGSFSSWDRDGDGKFGERSDDKPDLYPDVYVGRLPASSTADLNLLIKRITGYTTPPAKALMVGVELFWDTDTREGEYLKEVVSNEINIDTIKLYETDNYERDGEANEREIAEEINKGVMMVNFASHGNPGGMGWNAGHFTISDLSLLHNSFMPVAFAMACSTNEFDGEDCLGEMFLLNPGGGGIAYAGSSRVAYVYLGSAIKSGLSGYLDKAFFRAYYDDNTRVGEMFAAAKESYVSHIPFMGKEDLLTVMEYNLMGDPTIEFPPMPLTSRATVDKEFSDSSVTISAMVSDNGTVDLYYRKKTNIGGRWKLYGSIEKPPYKWEFSPEEDGYYEFYTILKKENYTENAPDVADSYCLFDFSSPNATITKPEKGGIYLFNNTFLHTNMNFSIVIGKIDVTVEGNGIHHVEFYLDGKLEYTDYDKPFTWKWKSFAIGMHEIKAIAYNGIGKETEANEKVLALIP